jgi:hypothetical protein
MTAVAFTRTARRQAVVAFLAGGRTRELRPGQLPPRAVAPYTCSIGSGDRSRWRRWR